MTRIVMVMGAGGVGKTTVAAAFGCAEAFGGQRTLVMTVDPARRLAAALGTDLGHSPRPVPGVERLDAQMLDSIEAWKALIQREAPASASERLLESPFFAAMAQRFPSGQAFAALDVVERIAASGRYELVVVDTPPDRAGRELLEAPQGVKRLLGGKALGLLTASRVPGRRLAYSLTTRPLLRSLDRLLGSSLMAALGDFLIDLGTIHPMLRERSRKADAALARADLLVVTTAQPGPMETAAALARHPVPGGARRAVFNRWLPDSWAAAPPASDSLGKVLALWGREADRQQRLRGRFADATGLDTATVPLVVPPPADPAGLAALAPGRL